MYSTQFQHMPLAFVVKDGFDKKIAFLQILLNCSVKCWQHLATMAIWKRGFKNAICKSFVQNNKQDDNKNNNICRCNNNTSKNNTRPLLTGLARVGRDRRHGFRHDGHKDGHRQQDGEREAVLLALLVRQQEHAGTQQRQDDHRQDHVDDVVGSLPLQLQVKLDAREVTATYHSG